MLIYVISVTKTLKTHFYNILHYKSDLNERMEELRT